jgi:hypothetical protein
MSEYGKFILPMNNRATLWVQAVAEKLISKNGLGHVVTRATNSGDDQKPDEWLVYVVDQDIKNAFVMPGTFDRFVGHHFPLVCRRQEDCGILRNVTTGVRSGSTCWYSRSR